MNNPLPSKISGNVHVFVFYETMYFILFYVESSTQRKLPGPQKGVISRSLKFLMQKDGREFLLQKIDIPRELIETKMCTNFERERFRIEGEKLNFKLLEFSNSWNGIVRTGKSRHTM